MTGRSVVVLAIALLTAAGLVLIAGILAPGGRATTVRPATDAAQPPGCGPGRSAVGARWWRLRPETDRFGALAGWTLRVGGRDGRISTADLPAESVVTGPVGGLIAVAADDGRTSRIELLREAGCGIRLAERREVVRALALDPAGRRLAIHLVDRATREDRGIRVIDVATGVERSSVDPASTERLARVGLERAWRTFLLWDRPGHRLAVAACEPAGCLTRIIDVAARHEIAEVVGTADPVALDGERFVAWERCSAVPCPLLAIDVSTGDRTVLAGDAVAARPAGADGIGMETVARPGAIRVVDLRRGLAVDTDLWGAGVGLHPGAARVDGDVELPDGWLPLADEGGDPQRAMRVGDGRSTRLEEVIP